MWDNQYSGTNPSNPDTNGTEQSVRIKEYTVLGGKKCLIIIREVSSFQWCP